jgi:hypothetical protein
MKIKCLAVHQPYASLIAGGDKTIEVRSWITHFRGLVLICATKRPVVMWSETGGPLPTGCTVAVVRLIDCRPMMKQDAKAACVDFIDGAWAWIFDEIFPVEQIPIKGQQGLFNPPKYLSFEMDFPVWAGMCGESYHMPMAGIRLSCLNP